jgi:hypothetical protein
MANKLLSTLFCLVALFISFNRNAANNLPLDGISHAGFVQYTNLITPANGATNVAVTSALTWEPATGNPDAYVLTVGTTPNGTDIFNGDVGNVTTFNPPGDFPYSTTIYVKIVGYNANGPAQGCLDETFTTEASPFPGCTSLTSPANGATNVSPIAVLNWTAASGNPPPTGYRLDVGTTSGGTDILNNFNVGNVTSYDPPGYLPYSSQIYVKIKPYNGNGPAQGCPEESFTTASCIPDLTIVVIPIPSGSHRSMGDLTSYESTVTNGSDVEFTSDTGVLLDHDFTVELGGIFEILIQPCPPPGPPPSFLPAQKAPVKNGTH